MEKKKEHPAVAKALAMMKKNKADRTKGVYSGVKPSVSVDQIMQEYRDKQKAKKAGEDFIVNKAQEDQAAASLKEKLNKDRENTTYMPDPEMQKYIDAINADKKDGSEDKYDSSTAESILNSMKKKKGK